ncbi:MAG: hypothetical protein WCB68_03255 [Pyrinomonadaceae bacterium]
MFCPNCGATQNEDLKFCKQCGANMQAVRQVMLSRDEGEKFDWSKTWVAEMFMSEAAKKARELEIERIRGITPEVKRYNEIKGGVITSFVGVGIMLFLFIFMNGLIRSGQAQPNEAEVLRVLWVAGVIPLCVGLALIFNGLFVSKRLVKLQQQELQANQTPTTQGLTGKTTDNLYLPQADSSEFIPQGFSVTEDATKQLRNAGQKR